MTVLRLAQKTVVEGDVGGCSSPPSPQKRKARTHQKPAYQTLKVQHKKCLCLDSNHLFVFGFDTVPSVHISGVEADMRKIIMMGMSRGAETRCRISHILTV